MEKQITVNNSKDVLVEIENAFYDIPFENSIFQIKNFLIANQITPARAYRSLGLRLHDRLTALQSAKFSKMKAEVDIDEIHWKLQNNNISVFDKRRLEIELMEREASLPFSNKLIQDAITECNYLYSELQKFPKYTREQFEAEEEKHFLEKSKRQVVGITGGKESLMNISHDKQAFEQFFNLLQDGDLQKALDNMENVLQLEDGSKS